MTRPYSDDLRERVLSSVWRGEAIRGVAARFGVSPSFVSKLGSRYKRTGSMAPDPQGGDHRSARIEAHADWLLDRVAETPDITLAELCAELNDRGLETVPSTVWRFFDRHGLTLKKRRRMQANRTGQM
jgi:transposase